MEHGGFNELVWHFAGYMRVVENVATVRLEYGGAALPSVQLQAIIDKTEDDDNNLHDLKLGQLHKVGLANLFSYEEASFIGGGNVPIHELLAELAPDVPDVEAVIESVPRSQASPLSSFTEGDTEITSFTITFLYRVSGPQTHIFNASSQNMLIDNDLLINDAIDVSGLGFSSQEELLESIVDNWTTQEEVDDLLALAEDQMPSFLTLGDGDSDELESSAMDLAEALAMRAKALAEMSDEGEESDMEETDSEPQEISSEGSSDEGDMQESNSESDEVSEPSEMSDEGPLEEGDEETPMMAESEAEPDQLIHLGSNETVNVASIIDISEAGASMVVLGDYFESNAIVQTNIFSFDDNDNTSDVLPEDPMLGETNFVVNDATMARDTGEALVPAPLGFSLPAYTFQVDYILGDFFDLNVLTQFNDLTDNDALIYETHTQNYMIETGDNTLVNAAQILDLYMQYDMIVVEGTYNEINLIKQTNIMLDVDSVAFGGTFEDAFVSDGNIMENTATIQNIGGGDLFQPLTDDVTLLAESIANFETSLTFENADIDFGMALNTPSEVNVLYVSGDFYQLNAILQTNILTDEDAGLLIGGDATGGTVLATVDAADAEEPGDPVYATGDNLARNDATIIDYDSQSEFQYLGGELYEQDILIQVEFVAPENEATQMAGNPEMGELATEVIAFAGMSDSEPSDQNNEQFVPVSDSTVSPDMMGSMMA